MPETYGHEPVRMRVRTAQTADAAYGHDTTGKFREVFSCLRSYY